MQQPFGVFLGGNAEVQFIVEGKILTAEALSNYWTLHSNFQMKIDMLLHSCSVCPFSIVPYCYYNLM